MKLLNYEAIYKESYDYYLKYLKKEEEKQNLVYIHQAIFFELILDLLYSATEQTTKTLNKQQIEFILDYPIDFSHMMKAFYKYRIEEIKC